MEKKLKEFNPITLKKMGQESIIITNFFVTQERIDFISKIYDFSKQYPDLNDDDIVQKYLEENHLLQSVYRISIDPYLEYKVYKMYKTDKNFAEMVDELKRTKNEKGKIIFGYSSTEQLKDAIDKNKGERLELLNLDERKLTSEKVKSQGVFVGSEGYYTLNEKTI
ncbi:hypothetical protein [Capnocytophaga leadbetteri]|uniref:hypothetical protein n=1 Tax=Capnocytophaga leadbetteri TaxID=327575 RepID=UPI0028F11C9E|nr:hypothetical protein [Capnocytophaga leadbetteri]